MSEPLMPKIVPDPRVPEGIVLLLNDPDKADVRQIMEIVRENAALRARLAEVEAEHRSARSIVASVWDFLRERGAVAQRDGSDHDRILSSLGLWEDRVRAEAVREMVENMSDERAVGIARTIKDADPRPTGLAGCAALMRSAILSALTPPAGEEAV